MKFMRFAAKIAPVLLFAVILSFMLVLGTAQAAEEELYTYTTYNNKATITGCDTTISGNVVIPTKLGGYPVTTISYKAFENCTALTAVTIPDSVTSINQHAFQACTGLTSVTIGSGVTGIGDYPFDGCSSLAGIWVSKGNTAFSNDSYGVLFNKDKTTLLYAPQKLSGSYAIPQGVVTIGKTAFRDCVGLTSVMIPEGVTQIESSAFNRCSGLVSVSMPQSVTVIEDSAFYRCSALTSVTIPEKVATIETGVFSSCTGLTTIVIPDNVTAIRTYAFRGCSGLKTVVLPKGLQKIEQYAFYNTLNIDTIYYKGTEAEWKNVTLKDRTSAFDANNNWYWVPITYDFAGGIAGDIDGNVEINDADAMYLLRYTLFGATRYPLSAGADVNSDGVVNDADAMYLLRYTLFPERYPLYPTVS